MWQSPVGHVPSDMTSFEMSSITPHGRARTSTASPHLEHGPTVNGVESDGRVRIGEHRHVAG